MKKRGLIWNFQNLYGFTLSKYLQEKSGYILYSIYDIPDNLKKTFEQQTIVNYEKSWYFFDHIKNVQRKPDLEYLENIEKKYEINLWQLVINERFFYQFNYHSFSPDEVLLIIEQECKFFESVLKEIKPEFVIIEQPYFHYQQIFYEICKKQDIDMLILNQNRLNKGHYLSSNLDKFDDKKINSENTKHRNKEELLKYLENKTVTKSVNFTKRNLLISRTESIKAVLRFLFSHNSNPKTHFTYYGRTKFKVLLNKIIIEFLTKYRGSFYEKNSINKIDSNSKFVFYPFSIDMESTLLIWAPFYTNQIELIKNIARSLPIGYELYVKEHPLSYSRGWKSISDYKKLLELPNVKLLSVKLHPKEIISKASLVVGITSTAVLESAFQNKPSIIFQDNVFSHLSSIFRIRNIEELPKIIKKALHTEVDTKELNDFVNEIEKNSFDFDYFNFTSDVSDYFFHNGSIVDIEIPEEKLKTFVEKQREIFSVVTSEYIKKIES
tara:strand:+ start:58 stop:1542 length:1485 start_codon:yes stop_codon:yes gene_type:complete